MSNNSGKAIGGAGTLGLFAILRMCSHEGGELFNAGRIIAEHESQEVQAIKDVSTRSENVAEFSGVHDRHAGAEGNVEPNASQQDNINNKAHQTLNDGSLNEITVPYEIHNDVVITNQDLPVDEIKNLSAKGVKFICNRTLYEQQAKITNYKILYIYSADVDKLKVLYGINDTQAHEVAHYSANFIDQPKVQTIESREQLDAELQNCKTERITPIVLFHNNDSKLFDTPIQDFQFTNVITCNSYQLPLETFFKSTDFIDLKFVVKSLNEAISVKDQNLFEFYSNFSKTYSNHLQANKNVTVTIMLTSTVATAG